MSQAVCYSARHQHECYIVAVETHVVPSPGKILDMHVYISWQLTGGRWKGGAQGARTFHCGDCGVGDVVDRGGMR